MSEDVFHLGIKGVLRNSSGKLLLLRVNPVKLRSKGDYWDLPGGRVQKNQPVIDTLKREIAEETGLTEITDIKELGMVLSNLRIPLGGADSVGLILGVYECKARDVDAIVLSDEHTEYRWFTPKEAGELLAVKYPQHFCELIARL